MYQVTASGFQSFCWEICLLPIEDLLYVMRPFSLTAFKSLFFFALQTFDYDVSWCGSLGVHLMWDSLSLVNIYIPVFNQTGEVFSPNFFKYFFCPFSFLLLGLLWCIHILIALMVSHASLRLCLLYFTFFLFSNSNFHCPIFKFADSFSTF